MHTLRRSPLLRTVACACALAASTPAFAQQGTPVRTQPAQQSRRDSSVVALARQQLGRRYLFGGTSPDAGFDCSGFVRYLMRAFGVEAPRTAAQMAQTGREVPRDVAHLRVGDILTFGSSRTGRVSHVGIYIGNGRFIHASTGAGRIVEASLDREPNRLVKAWLGVRRLFDGDSAAAIAQR